MTEPTRATEPDAARIKLRLATVLRAEVERLDTTVSALARKAGIPQRTLQQYFAASVEPSLSRLLAVERAIGRRPGWLSRQVAVEPDTPDTP